MADDKTPLFADFEPFAITTQSSPEITIRGLRSKTTPSTTQLPPLLLLHGFPQTLHIWHRVAPRLTTQFTVILLDLRGYGSSSKPANDTTLYAKSAMAADCAAVMTQLGHTGAFHLCGHDRGARVGHKLCVDFPSRVKRALFLDICPTLAMYEATDTTFASAYWHWFFLIQQTPMPELMILGAARATAERFMGGRQGEGLAIFRKECWEEYVKALSDMDTVHAMCQDYRAAASLDLEEQRGDIAAGRRIRCPLTVLWGKHGVVEKCFDALAEWRKVTEPGVSVNGHAVESGHYIPEQVPDDVVTAIKQFLE